MRTKDVLARLARLVVMYLEYSVQRYAPLAM
jgi:hypothetical protein